LSKNERKTFNKDIAILFFYVIIPVLVSLPIILFIIDWYYEFQVSKLSNLNTLLFVHDSTSTFILIFSPMMLIFLLMLNIKSNTQKKIMKVKIYLFAAIFIFIISAIALFIGFFNFTDISKDGIYVSKGIGTKKKYYKWSEVASAEVSFRRGGEGDIDISYDLYINDGTIIKAFNSKDFFLNIVNLDKYIENKNIPISRSTIHSSDYIAFESDFKGDEKSKVDRLEVLYEIFRK
jgi:hypothetical protein